jgi:hypothetical protein
VEDRVEQKKSSLLVDYMPREEFAIDHQISLRTEARWRASRASPPHVRIGKKIWYRRAGVQDWLRAREIVPIELRGVKR